MELGPYSAHVRNQLIAAAALGDERTREIAAALATAAESAVRIAVLDALSAATAEITGTLHDTGHTPTPIAVTVQLDGEQVRFSVTAPPAEPVEPASRPDDGEASARISLRLSESLKASIEQAASQSDLSVNSWLIRAANSALQPPATASWSTGYSGKQVTGWITG